jgi:hypothetical protein
MDSSTTRPVERAVAIWGVAERDDGLYCPVQYVKYVPKLHVHVCGCPRRLEAAGNIDITKKIEYLIPTTCLSDVRVFEAKS